MTSKPQKRMESLGHRGSEWIKDPLDLLDPLDEFYRQSNQPMPQISIVDGVSIPQPYRDLLVHSNDMTPTLETAYQDRIHLRVLKCQVVDDTVSREVVLVLDRDETPVEFGAIRIHLEWIPQEAQKSILEGHLPLGRILTDFKVEHSSRPAAYFRVLSDAEIGHALSLNGQQNLYGRRNRLLTPFGKALAEVIEILPLSNPYEAV